MNKPFRLILFTFIALLIPYWIPFSHGTPKTHFSIVYTNDVMGEVEPCG